MDYIISHTDPANGSFVIKPYTVNGPATPAGGSLYPGAVAANTSLILFGKGDLNYGEGVAKDLVHLLENFAGPTAPFYTVQGQMWYNNSITNLSIYNGATWKEVVINGFLAADLSVNGKKITNLGNATLSTDAVNLQTGDGRYLQLLTGGTVTGLVTLSGGATGLPAPTLPTDAATKAYVDSVAVPSGVFVQQTGDTMTGNLLMTSASVLVSGGGDVSITNGDLVLTGSGIVSTGVATFDFGGNELKNLLSPTVSTSAATKGYVDAAIAAIPPTLPDGVVFAGLVTGTTLTLSRTVGPDVVIAGISPSNHVHAPSEITFDGNPSIYDNSRIRQLSANQPFFPNVSLADVITYFDQDLHSAMNRKRRTLFTLADYSITAVTTGLNGTWTIVGDHTDEFVAGYVVQVQGNSDGPTNTTYTVQTAVFSAGNTVITVTGTIPAGATVTGTIRSLTRALDLDSEYIVEYNRLTVHGNGLKLYASERGNTYIILPGVVGGSWSGLLNGSYSFDLAVDGTPHTGISFTVAQPSYTINGVTPGGNVWTISGNHANEFVQYEKLVIFGNTGLGPATNNLYDVVSAVNSGANTNVTVSQTISVAATPNGTMESALLIIQLEPLVNAALITATAPATFDADTSLLQFFSNSVGTNSQTVFADVDFVSTIATNLALSPTLVNRPMVATDLGYKEMGDPFTTSSLIELNQTVATGTVVEAICT